MSKILLAAAVILSLQTAWSQQAVTAPLVNTDEKTHPKSPLNFTDFGAYAAIPRALAADPKRQIELDFVKSCRSRLRQEVDRSPDTASLIERFKKEFDEKQVSYPTKLAIALMISHREKALTLDEGEFAARLLFSDATTQGIELESLKLYARCFIDRYRIGGLKRVRDYEIKKQLKSYIEANSQAPELAKNSELQALLFSVFTQEYKNGWTEQNAAIDEEFSKWLDGLPAEKKSYESECALGIHYRLEAWRRRGSAWAANTTQEQFHEFGRLIKEAAVHLRRAHELKPQSNIHITELLTIAMVDEDAAGGDSNYWLGQSKNQRDPALLERYTDANQPRWGGSPENVMKAYNECLKSKDFDSPLPGLLGEFIRVLVADATKTEKPKIFHRCATDFIPIANEYTRRINEGSLPLVNAGGFPIDHRAMALAWLADANLLKEAPQLIAYNRAIFPPETNTKMQRLRWGGIGLNYAEALASAEANDYKLIDASKRHHEADSALDAETLNLHNDPKWLREYGDDLKKMATKVQSPLARKLMTDLIELNQTEQDFIANKPAKLIFSDNLWITQYIPIINSHSWWGEFLEHHAYSCGYNSVSWSHRATYGGMFTPPYELKLRVRCSNQAVNEKAGVMVGRNMSGISGRAFLFESGTGNFFVTSPGVLSKDAPLKGSLKRRTNDALLTVRIFDHGYSFSLDDAPAIKCRDDQFTPYVISIGVPKGESAYGRFDYSDMTVHRLKPEECSDEEKSWMNQK